MLAKVELSLLQSLADLHIRNEVDDCIRSMLLDVETTYHLQQQLELKAAQERLRQTQTEQRATILEANTERLERQDRRLELADHMVVELAKLNRELQQLQEWKEEHEYKVRNYDTVLAKLAQTEEELREANRVSFGGGAKPRRDEETFSTPSRQHGGASSSKENTLSASDTMPSARTLFHDPAPPQSATFGPKESIPENTPEVPVDAPDFTTYVPAASDPTEDPFGDRKPAAKDTQKPSPLGGESAGQEDNAVKEVSNGGLPPVTLEELPTPVIGTTDGVIPEIQSEQLASIDEEDKKAAAATVVLIEDEKSQAPSLMTLDVEVLMNIFGFIDAMDILNTAQINVTMYNKVDNIFGISEDGQTPPTPTPLPAPAPAPKPPQRQAAAAAAAAPPSLLAPPPAASKPAPADSKPTTADSAAGPLGKGLFAMLQPKPAAALTSPSAAALAARGGISKPQSQQQQQQPLNLKVAQSMASKLSDAEVAAIISMTDKLSKLEKEVHLLRNDKEVLAAKLDGTEAVKQFLIGKVRDVEVKLNRSKEDEIKITQQIASDQEVIAFLDSRVQELEQLTEDLTKEKSTMQVELESLKVSTSKKITMLSDMLKYEREKLREDEGEWKATKKVLVREVKSCRAQLLALQAERDGFKEQNDMLKRAIVSTGGSSKSNAHHNGPSHARRKLT
jgi:hypothetical protein